MPAYTIICRSALTPKAIAALKDAGIYRMTGGSTGWPPDDPHSHQLVIEADDADLALEKARSELMPLCSGYADLEVAGESATWQGRAQLVKSDLQTEWERTIAVAREAAFRLLDAGAEPDLKGAKRMEPTAGRGDVDGWRCFTWSGEESASSSGRTDGEGRAVTFQGVLTVEGELRRVGPGTPSSVDRTRRGRRMAFEPKPTVDRRLRREGCEEPPIADVLSGLRKLLSDHGLSPKP